MHVVSAAIVYKFINIRYTIHYGIILCTFHFKLSVKKAVNINLVILSVKYDMCIINYILCYSHLTCMLANKDVY